MNISEIIEVKKSNKQLSKEEIEFVISLYNRGKLSDAKMIEFLKMIDVDTFSYEETYYLAQAIARTGKRFDVNKDVGRVIDTQSVGQYSDASTLIFMSVLASLGYKNIKSISSVYGTFNNSLDRLSLFDGFNAKISRDRLVQIINKTGMAVIEDDEFSLVDKRLYELTRKFHINSIPFTTASIMAKKIATGATSIVFDVKTGEGAMFSSVLYAETLAKYLVETAKLAGFNASSVISNLDEPLGASVGLRVEVEEILSVLRSEKSLYYSKLLNVSKELVVNALLLSDKNITRTDASEMFDEAIITGRALDKFREFIAEYGGEYEDFKHSHNKLLDGVHVSYLTADKVGIVNDIIISQVVKAYKKLAFKDDKIVDKNAGIVLLVGEGVKVSEGDYLARIFYNIDNKNFAQCLSTLKNAFEIDVTKPKVKKILYKVVI